LPTIKEKAKLNDSTIETNIY